MCSAPVQHTVTQTPVADHELSDEEIRESFGHRIDLFVKAVSVDCSYGAEILEHANQMIYKKTIWQVRTEVTRAENEAHNRCNIDHREHEMFECCNTAPCGFGTCPYAKPQHRLKIVVSSHRTRPKKRPRYAALHPEYYLEDAIDTLMAQRRKTA